MTLFAALALFIALYAIIDEWFGPDPRDRDD